MNKFHLTHAEATVRVGAVIEAVTTAGRWPLISHELSTLDVMGCRELFRDVFDTYETQNGVEWLGILDWAVVEEIRRLGFALVADHATVDRIVTRMEHHPDLRMRQ